MGSVLDYIECPNCGHEATDDFYYKTGEEYINCSHCGYHRSATIINREKRLIDLVEEDWKIVEIKDPYGAYSISYSNSAVRQCGTLETEEQLKAILMGSSLDSPIDCVKVSKYINGKIEVEKILQIRNE